jgi:hypothetical protein
MKVVINQCHGGFGLSEKACQWLIENKAWAATEYNEDGNTYKDPTAKLIKSKTSWAGENPYYLIGRVDENKIRTDPDLIEVIETLGKKASDRFADLGIVEIPDDVGDNWEIAEYDGAEWVQEVHRRWS